MLERRLELASLDVGEGLVANKLGKVTGHALDATLVLAGLSRYLSWFDVICHNIYNLQHTNPHGRSLPDPITTTTTTTTTTYQLKR